MGEKRPGFLGALRKVPYACSAGVLLVVLGLPVRDSAAEAAEVSWGEVRASLAQAICAEEGENGLLTIVTNDRHRCGVVVETPLSRALDDVFQDAGLILIALRSDPPYQEPPENVEEATRRVRDYYLASPSYLRPVLRRLRQALAKEGLRCKDCPQEEASPPRRIAWADLLPYLTAHIWPDPVVTPRGPDGRPTGRPQYSYHICAGINGVARIENPDPLLVRAGFLAAAETQPLQERARQIFHRIVGKKAMDRLEDDASRTEWLRQRFAKALAADPEIRRTACATLERRKEDLALEIAECAGSGKARSGGRHGGKP